MCDANNFNDMNEFQDMCPCDMTYNPQMQQMPDNCENVSERQFCPPSCDQCMEESQMNLMCCEPSQNEVCYDYQPQEQQCCESFEAADMNCCPQECPQYSSSEHDVDPNEHKPSYCPCPERCQMPSCSPYSRKRYIQPPRQRSFKPVVNYQKPEIPFSCDTIYKKSFEGFDSAALCRPPLSRPKGFFKSPNCPFEKETVTKLSFQPYCKVERTRPIIPQSPSLLGKGPMQGLTTQRHDFVPKFQYRRTKINPRDLIKKNCGCFEKNTTQRMSFMLPCADGRRESFRPNVSYKRPELPMECETTQKLSYMPVCPAPREDMPWAKKAKYLPPTIGFAKDTVTKLSYQPPGCFVDECCVPKIESFCEILRC